MKRRDFVWTFTTALAAGLASSAPLIMAHGSCSFCSAGYPEAAWIAETPDGSRRICDRCASAVETALGHLGNNDYDAAVDVLERHFPSVVRVAPDAERAPFLMM